MTQREALSKPFPTDEIRHFAGRGGQEMSYIEDETVMDRLDDVFGVGGWQIHTEPIPVYEGVVRVKLSVLINDEWRSYEDFGYPNREGGEALKEAVSDGIRRCGRYLGIARDLYRKPTTSSRPVGASPGRPAPTPQPPTPAAAGGAPEEPEWVRDQLSADEQRAVLVHTPTGVSAAECPIHHKPWKVNSRGGYCPSKNPDGSWCQEKPGKAA